MTTKYHDENRVERTIWLDSDTLYDSSMNDLPQQNIFHPWTIYNAAMTWKWSGRNADYNKSRNLLQRIKVYWIEDMTCRSKLRGIRPTIADAENQIADKSRNLLQRIKVHWIEDMTCCSRLRGIRPTIGDAENQIAVLTRRIGQAYHQHFGHGDYCCQRERKHSRNRKESLDD